MSRPFLPDLLGIAGRRRFTYARGDTSVEGGATVVGAKVHRLVNERTGNQVARHIEEAAGLWGSFKGLMLRPQLPEGHGMLFRPARGIHTNFMRFPLDLVFFDKSGTVTKIRERIVPWRLDLTMADGCIEMNGGAARAAGIEVGDTLRLEPVVA